MFGLSAFRLLRLRLLFGTSGFKLLILRDCHLRRAGTAYQNPWSNYLAAFMTCSSGSYLHIESLVPGLDSCHVRFVVSSFSFNRYYT